MTETVFAINSKSTLEAVRNAVALAKKGKLKAVNAVPAQGYTFEGSAGHLGYVVGDCWIYERLIPPDIRPWRPFIRTVPVNRLSGEPDPVVAELGLEDFYANSHYLVFTRTLHATFKDQPDGLHLSMRTVENDTRHDWREMQRVKNDIAGKHWEGVEIYPDVDRLVDSANQYHLWCWPFQLPFGFKDGLVADHGSVEQIGGAQRPLAEGDTRD